MTSMRNFNVLQVAGNGSALNYERRRHPLTVAVLLLITISFYARASSAQTKSVGKQLNLSHGVVAATVSTATQTTTVTPEVNAGVQTFLTGFVAAMNAHDPDAFFRLQAEDCATVNRAGRFFRDRASLSIQIERLLKQSFKDFQFPPFRILHQRSLTPDLVILQAAWQNPSLEPPPAPPVSDMVVTFLLKKTGSVWLAEEVDSHDVEGLPAVPGETQVLPSAGAPKQ